MCCVYINYFLLLSRLPLMARSNIRSIFLYVVVCIFFFFFASLYHHSLHDPTTITTTVISAGTISRSTESTAHVVVQHQSQPLSSSSPSPSPPPTNKLPIPTTTSILLPDWEVLVVINDPPTWNHTEKDDGDYLCHFDTNEETPAKFSGSLLYPERPTFTCVLPTRARRRLPFTQPRLTPASPEISPDPASPPFPPLLRWSYLVYDSLTTDEDVVLFVKGVNTRQGVNRDPTEFLCVFNGVNKTVKTTVTSSMQEVFRCFLPPDSSPDSTASVSIEIISEGKVVPSVAYYSPRRTLTRGDGKSLTCASTMVYNVAKFLKEWVSYYSRIGVDRFLLYDNGSDDDLRTSVDQLTQQGYDVAMYHWLWPKTQEAGFSHSAIFARDSCTWMMYVDVDEFLYSPSWIELPRPDRSLLPGLITASSSELNASKIGQISINCLEFGPSDQKEHPKGDVMQGYDCRKRLENRHKSIVLLEAVDSSLINAIHHFQLKPEYATWSLNTTDVVVNHYKYQAWPEFKAKFRRRVSAYVIDWTQKVNPTSNDRTPGLGFSAIEPEDWPQKFCEVRDQRLKDLSRKWFAVNGSESEGDIRMSWQLS